MNPWTAPVAADAVTLQRQIATLPRPLVFTNGCFDLLHAGHVDYLAKARGLGASLLVAVNSDASVRRLGKGGERPINLVADRMAVVAGLASVDLVTSFEEDTPLELILAVRPDVLVKGGDWRIEDMVGSREVRSWGGRVETIPVRFDRSTSAIVSRIRAAVLAS